jgi:hypothetical protein
MDNNIKTYVYLLLVYNLRSKIQLNFFKVVVVVVVVVVVLVVVITPQQEI